MDELVSIYRSNYISLTLFLFANNGNIIDVEVGLRKYLHIRKIMFNYHLG